MSAMVEGDASGVTTPVPKAKAQRKKVADFTLAKSMEDSRLVRDVMREHGRLIRWVSEEKKNVISLECLGLNSGVMCLVAAHHCSVTTVVKPPSIDFLKAQATVSWKHFFFAS